MKSSKISQKKLKEIQTKFKEIDKFFLQMKNDKNLPLFGEFFMLCLLSGTAECVNLKKMYPKTYVELNKFLKEHDRFILKRQGK